MSTNRSESLEKLVSVLEDVDIFQTDYLKDLEPMGIIDAQLSGLIDALAHYCQALGWSDLSVTLREQLPLSGTAPTAINTIQGYVLPEIRHLMESTDINSSPSSNDWFWNFIHPCIRTLARSRYEAGEHGDAILASVREVNNAVKSIYLESETEELDGARLMTRAFSIDNPIIRLTPLTSETEKNIQKGYMQLFAGAMTGIRNPKAHNELHPDSSRTLHMISLASFLMYILDDRMNNPHTPD